MHWDCTPRHFVYPSKPNLQKVLSTSIIQILLCQSGLWEVVLNAAGLQMLLNVWVCAAAAPSPITVSTAQPHWSWPHVASHAAEMAGVI